MYQQHSSNDKKLNKMKETMNKLKIIWRVRLIFDITAKQLMSKYPNTAYLLLVTCNFVKYTFIDE